MATAAAGSAASISRTASASPSTVAASRPRRAIPGSARKMSRACRRRLSITALANACTRRSTPAVPVSIAALSLGQLANPQLAGDDQLGRGQAGYALERRWVVAAEALRRRRITAAGRIAQLLRLAAQLVEIGALGKRIGHGVSLLRLRSAAQAEEEATAEGEAIRRWTQSFPR